MIKKILELFSKDKYYLNDRIGINPPPKSKRPELPYSDDSTICKKPDFEKPPRPGYKSNNKNRLSSGNYKIVNFRYDDYSALNQVNFDKMYLLKDLETGATEWVDEDRLRAMKKLGLLN